MSERDANLQPNFLIPPGTQVVLRYARRLPGTDDEKPAGSVAEVVESPATNDRAYLVRFLDGTELRLKFGELLARRGDHTVDQISVRQSLIRVSLVIILHVHHRRRADLLHVRETGRLPGTLACLGEDREQEDRKSTRLNSSH